MPTISFTQNLKRHLSVPRAEVRGATVRDALESAARRTGFKPGHFLDLD